MDVTYRIWSAGTPGLLMNISSICVRKLRNRCFKEVAQIAANYPVPLDLRCVAT
jgi:hypothetical protein